jgi:hypothetical protein
MDCDAADLCLSAAWPSVGAGDRHPLIMTVIEPIWSTKPETANRARGRIEAILDWAKVRGYRHGENSARWRVVAFQPKLP